MSQWRFPAEWEPQSAILLAWPHAGTDWAERLAEVEDTYIALVGAITRFQPAVDLRGRRRPADLCRSPPAVGNRVDMQRVRFVTVPYDDTWLRDSGPITCAMDDDAVPLLDFRFTGWGGKFEASRRRPIDRRLLDRRLFRTMHASRLDRFRAGRRRHRNRWRRHLADHLAAACTSAIHT
jgi:agmatine/peptidylarginine deiminase